jgi:phosphatidylserine/phosphatidylglycerophosphate/cardiolipin synthase-like enzyme
VKRLAAVLLALLLAACAAVPAASTASIEVAFTPWDDAEGVLLRLIDGARKSVRVQAYLLTSRTLARALIEAERRGVDVQVLADREMTVKGENSQIPQLVAAGIPVWLEVRYAAAHNKILVADPLEESNVVATGSYNYTYSAQARNAENLIVIRGDSKVAKAYLDNWQRHRADALPYAQAVQP